MPPEVTLDLSTEMDFQTFDHRRMTIDQNDLPGQNSEPKLSRTLASKKCVKDDSKHISSKCKVSKNKNHKKGNSSFSYQMKHQVGAGKVLRTQRSKDIIRSHKSPSNKIRTVPKVSKTVFEQLRKISTHAEQRGKGKNQGKKPESAKPKLEKLVSSEDNAESNYYTSLGSPMATPQSASSLGSSKPVKRKESMDANLNRLDTILRDKQKSNHGEFSFSDYMSILKSLNLVSTKICTKQEETLLTKSWHQISFFQNGNIVTNYENIQTFVSGILGLTEPWM